MNDILGYTITDFGGVPITVGKLIFAGVAIALALLASRLLVRLLSRVRDRMPNGGAGLYILEKLGGYTIIVVGFLFALTTLGVNLSSLAVFAGALGVGVGLGLQGVVKEFVSGIVLLFDDILSVGDYIELPGGDGVRGIVASIGSRATRIRSNDNVDILVPNSRLIEERFVNWTLKGQTRRIHVPFTVAYGVDKAVVRDVVLEAARSLPSTLPDDGARRSQVWLTGFGDSALNFELVVWPTLEAVKRPAAMQAAYTWAIDDALRQAAIEIPYPQRDIRIRSVFGREGDDALRALGQTPERPADPVTSTAATRNDAALDLQNSELPETELPADSAQPESA
jgi:small-conductance mechanosensitive channel